MDGARREALRLLAACAGLLAMNRAMPQQSPLITRPVPARPRATEAPLLLGFRPMTRVGRAVEKGETQGFMKVVVDAGTQKILGAATKNQTLCRVQSPAKKGWER